MADSSTLKITQNLKQLRREHHLTQVELANKAELNSNYYAKVERGTSVPSLKTVYKLSKALKVTATDILGF